MDLIGQAPRERCEISVSLQINVTVDIHDQAAHSFIILYNDYFNVGAFFPSSVTPLFNLYS